MIKFKLKPNDPRKLYCYFSPSGCWSTSKEQKNHNSRNNNNNNNNSCAKMQFVFWTKKNYLSQCFKDGFWRTEILRCLFWPNAFFLSFHFGFFLVQLIYGQFHQHFTRGFFVRAQLFGTYFLGLYIFGSW